MTDKQIERIKAAAERVQNILLDLQEDVGGLIDQVRVDTRNFANCSVEIFFAEQK